MKHWFCFALASFLVIAAGCANPPTEKLIAADEAVVKARDAGAATYMAEDLAKLESMVASARSEIGEQDAKLPFFRDYEKAEQVLASIQGEAARVAAEAAKKKAEAKASAVQAQQAAQEAVKTTQDLVAQAPAGKDLAALEAIKADAQGLAASLPDVQTVIDAGDYQAAQVKARAIQEKSQAMAAEVQRALEKVAKAKKSKPSR
jgi:hypothetical protein